MKVLQILILSILTITLTAQNVGVNITNPEVTLDIRSTSVADPGQFNLSNLDKSRYVRLFSGSDSYPDPSMSWNVGHNLLFATFNDNTLDFTEYMRISQSGNVGIGIPNPEAQLEIKGGDWNLAAGNPGDLRIGSSTNNLRIGVATGGGGAGITRIYSTNHLHFGVNNESAIYIEDGGKVGIGTVNPTAKATIIGPLTSAESVLKVESTYVGNANVVGIESTSYPANGYGVGANFYGGHRGLRGISNGENSTTTSIGLVGSGYGTDNVGTRIGIHGAAWGGDINWAGYFKDGNVYVTNDLRIGSGAIDGATGYKVAIDGKVIAEELRINLSTAWPDYVFDSSYDLMPLDQLESSIKENNHLPGIPSANEVENEGLIVGEMQTKMMEKIEELTLYILELNKELSQVKKELDNIKSNK